MHELRDQRVKPLRVDGPLLLLGAGDHAAGLGPLTQRLQRGYAVLVEDVRLLLSFSEGEVDLPDPNPGVCGSEPVGGALAAFRQARERLQAAIDVMLAD